MVVLTDRMPSVRSATLGFFFRTGARHEPAELHGMNHFIEHAVFKGTKRRSMLDIAIEQDRLGGNLEAFTTHEEVGFAIKVIDDQLPAAFDLIADMLADPRFDQADLEAEQRVIIEEMKMVDDSPEDYIGEIFAEAFFPDHPLGRSITGKPDTVRKFNAEVTRKYHEQAFTPANLVIVAAGNIEHDTVVALSSSFSSAAAPEDNPHAKPTTPASAAPIVIKEREGLEQAHLILATPFVGESDPRRYAADQLSTIIGEGTSSRLWQKIREERGLAYSIGSGTVMFQDCGNFSIAASASPEHVRELVELSVAELRAIVAAGVTPAELELAKRQAVTEVLLSLEDSSARAVGLAQSEMIHGRQISVEETLTGINRVTTDDCLQLAQAFFTTENLAFVALGDLKDVPIDRSLLTI